MNTFKKGDVVKSFDKQYTVAYKDGPYVYFDGGTYAHYECCNLIPQPKFGVGDTVSSSFGEAVVEKVLGNGRYTVRYDNHLGLCTNYESFYTLVRRADPPQTLGDILDAALKKRSEPKLSDVFDHINSGRLIEGIKTYRTIHAGVGLKEAKDACEAIRAALQFVPAPVATKPAPRDSIVVRFENGKYQPNSPPKVHPSLSDASAEAERLAKREPGIVFATFTLATHSTATAPVVSTVTK